MARAFWGECVLRAEEGVLVAMDVGRRLSMSRLGSPWRKAV